MLSDTAAAGYNGAGQYQQAANFEHYHSYQQHLHTQQHPAQVASAQAYQHSSSSQLIMHHDQHFQQQHVRDVSGRSSSGSLTGEAGGSAFGPAAMVASTSAHPFHPAATVVAIQTHQHHQHTNHQYHQYHHQRHNCQQQQQLASANTPAHPQAHPHAANLHPQAHQHQHQAHVQQPLANHQHAQQFHFYSHLGQPNRQLHHHHNHQPTMMASGVANSSSSPYGHAPISGHNHTPPSQYPQPDQQAQHQQYPAMSHYTQHQNSHPQHNTYGHAHTTPPFGGQPAGAMMPLGSPTDTIGEMSPVLMKQESVESRLAILTDHIDQSLKKESQLEQLHQQCASLLDEQQRAPLGLQHLMSSNLQHPEPKVGPNELNSDNRTPTLTNNNNNNNNNNTATNSNGNNTNARSKRPSPYSNAGSGGHNHTSPSQYTQHPEQQLPHQHQQHSALGHYTHVNSQTQHGVYAHAQTTPPFGGQPPGSMISLSSPRDMAEMSPGLMKQESNETRLAIQADPTLKKESQLEQLHQQCASLLDEQQRVPLVSSAGVQHLIPGTPQNPDSKLAPNETNSGSQTPTSTNNINNNNNNNTTTTTNNNNSNNNNANNNNSASGRSKRLRTSFKHHQLKEMKKWFSKNQNPDAKDLKTLAQTTGLSKRVLQVWFQNARAKFRRNNAKAVNQQLQYNVNLHTSHMLQIQQQAPDHPIHTYGQQHHLNQHTLISHHHHNHHHHHQQQQQHQSHLQGPPVSSAGVVAPIAMPTAVHTTPSDSSTHDTIQHQQAPVQKPHTQSQLQDGTAVVTGGDGCISSFAQLDIA